MEFTNLSFWQLFVQAGPVIWPILLCSVFAFAIIFEKMCFLHKIRVDTQKLLSAITDKIKRHEIKEALEVCDKVKSPIAQILKAGILKYDRSRPQIIEAIEDASLYEVPKLEKNLPLLAAIGHVAPLLGFLGTTLGMVKCFQIIQARANMSYPVTVGDLAGGIWQALLTTVAGLIVAIPVFLAYNYFVNRVNQLILEMEKTSTELVNFINE